MMMNEIYDRLATLEAKVNNITRIGVVTVVNDDGTVRVSIGDSDSITSYNLPVLFRKTHKDKFSSMPDVGEHVLCVFLPSGLEEGFVIGAFYSEADQSLVSSSDVFKVSFSDGTDIEYDRSVHKLTANVNGSVEATANKLTANINGSAEVTAQSLTINTEQTHNGNISLNGNLTVAGNVTMSGQMVSSSASVNNIDFQTHTHGNVENGGGSTGGAQ